MMDAAYYREQAARARRFATTVLDYHPDVARQLHDAAQDFEEIAADLEVGAVGVRHPDLLTDKQRGG